MKKVFFLLLAVLMLSISVSGCPYNQTAKSSNTQNNIQEESGEGLIHDTPVYKFFKSLTDCIWVHIDSETSPIPNDNDILEYYVFEEKEEKIFLINYKRNDPHELWQQYEAHIIQMKISNGKLEISTHNETVEIEKKSNDMIFVSRIFSSLGEGSLNPSKQIYKRK